MMRRSLLLGAFAAAAVVLAQPTPSPAAGDAAAFVNQLESQGMQALSAPTAQRAARFRQLFQADFDAPEIARFVLGRYWNTFSPQQQQEFVGVFEDFTAHAYAEKLGQYAGSPFKVIGTRPGEGGTVVTSEINRANGPAVKVDWHVVDRGGRFVVSDVVLDGVSMKVTERNEFAGIIQRNNNNPSAIIAVLRQQLQQGGASYGSSTTPRQQAPQPAPAYGSAPAPRR
jgi:phospholipid transport system substrate-binding protein